MADGVIYGLAHRGEIRYVGKTILDPSVRLKQHLYNSKKDRRGQRHLHDWLRSIDPEIPVIIVLERNPVCGVNEAERSWIALLRFYKCHLTNLTDGGDGQSPGYRHTVEARLRQSKAQQNKKMPPRTKEHSRKLAEATRGRKLSPEHRRKLSKALKGKPRILSAEGRISMIQKNSGLNSSSYGRPAWNRGKSFNLETRRKMSESAKRRHMREKGVKSDARL